MFNLRRLMLPALVALLLVTSASAAFAGGPVTVTHESADGAILTWSMSPDNCKQLQVPLSGTGEQHQEKTTKVYADGSSTILINDLVKGTASDSTGTYHFSYTNHSTETVPADGGAHQVQMVDSFVLNGNGSAKLNVGFNWRWTYNPSATPPDNVSWPPGVDLQKISTRGDPLTCDPI